MTVNQSPTFCCWAPAQKEKEMGELSGFNLHFIILRWVLISVFIVCFSSWAGFMKTKSHSHPPPRERERERERERQRQRQRQRHRQTDRDRQTDRQTDNAVTSSVHLRALCDTSPAWRSRMKAIGRGDSHPDPCLVVLGQRQISVPDQNATIDLGVNRLDFSAPLAG